MAVEVRVGDIVKETITYADGSDPATEFSMVTHTAARDPHLNKSARIILAYGSKELKRATTSMTIDIDDELYRGEEKFGGNAILPDIDYVNSDESPESTSVFELATKEEMDGLFFRTLIGEIVKM